ncbi:response regulator transcription factor [Streptomyces sp. NPDC047071]|uniref:response regulator transcription factor n=1 Tax=Streptomyces sp. NPDC047071 TaxID=3154808 RepID=UPI0034570CAA
MTSVLVVDDQDLIRAGVAALVRATPGFTSVTEAADGEAAVSLAERHRPDVVLMDVRLPGISGLTAAERILALDLAPPPRVVVLTTFDVDEYVYDALRIGACGYLLKDTPPERLLGAIATIAGGDALFAPTVMRRLIEAYTPRPGAVLRRPEQLAELTARELDVLTLVARGLTNDAIAAELFLSEGTVKTHLHRIMSKLDLKSRAQAVVVAYESGLVVPGSATGA